MRNTKKLFHFCVVKNMNTTRANSSQKWFLTIGFWEGISYLVLLFVAMPLKYWAGMDMAVKAVGSAHGALFVLFMLATAWAWKEGVLNFKQCVVAFLLSLVPFGTFRLHRLA
jgi:integral membrane protein